MGDFLGFMDLESFLQTFCDCLMTLICIELQFQLLSTDAALRRFAQSSQRKQDHASESKPCSPRAVVVR